MTVCDMNAPSDVMRSVCDMNAPSDVMRSVETRSDEVR